MRERRETKYLPAGNTSGILGGPQEGSVAMAPSRSILPGEREERERDGEKGRERGRGERERERGERRERERERGREREREGEAGRERGRETKHLPAGNTSDILGGPQGSVAMAPSRSILPGEIERGERERGRERERERERRERERESLVMAYYQRESLIVCHYQIHFNLLITCFLN